MSARIWVHGGNGTTGNKVIEQWLKSYDPDAHKGRGHTVFTKQKDEALSFESKPAAWQCWAQVSKVKPVRPDGKPNRPLTAFTVSILED